MKKVDSNSIIAIAALVTSVVAVFIAWDESRLMRRSQEAAFIPIIEIEGGSDFAVPDIHLRVHNTGHGVAYVESLEFLYENRPLTEWSEFSNLFLNPDLDRAVEISWDAGLGYYPIGEDRTVMAFQFPKDLTETLREHLLYDAAEAYTKFDVVACYCSVFGKCWTKHMLNRGRPEPVNACEPSKDPAAALWSGYVASRPGARTDG
ncbi:MAG: hypothetical protein AAF830_00980 [Pseudomonadota bacterium]